jgi:hypothetical protein
MEAESFTARLSGAEAITQRPDVANSPETGLREGAT